MTHYLCGMGASYATFNARLLAVRPALHFYTAIGLQTSYFCGIIIQRVKDLNLLGCVPAELKVRFMRNTRRVQVEEILLTLFHY